MASFHVPSKRPAKNTSVGFLDSPNKRVRALSISLPVITEDCEWVDIDLVSTETKHKFRVCCNLDASEVNFNDEWHTKNRLVRASAQKLFSKGQVLEAAMLGMPKAQSSLSKYYRDGTHGFEKDFSKFIKFAILAAEAGDLRAQFRLGMAFMLDESGGEKGGGAGRGGFATDLRESLKWFERAGHGGCARSANNAGILYFYGNDGVEQNLRKAYNWFSVGAKGGDSNSQCYLAGMHYDGVVVRSDPVEALRWYAKSAHQDHAIARRALRQIKRSDWGKWFLASTSTKRRWVAQRDMLEKVRE